MILLKDMKAVFTSLAFYVICGAGLGTVAFAIAEPGDLLRFQKLGLDPEFRLFIYSLPSIAVSRICIEVFIRRERSLVTLEKKLLQIVSLREKNLINARQEKALVERLLAEYPTKFSDQFRGW